MKHNVSRPGIIRGSVRPAAAACHIAKGGNGRGCLRAEMFRQIVEADLVGFAASTPLDNLARRAAQRFFIAQNVRRCASLVGNNRIGLRVIVVELKKFGRDVAGGLEGAGTEGIDNGDKGCAARNKGQREHQNKKQPHATIDRWLESRVCPLRPITSTANLSITEGF
jgi:hypothetical protein